MVNAKTLFLLLTFCISTVQLDAQKLNFRIKAEYRMLDQKAQLDQIAVLHEIEYSGMEVEKLFPRHATLQKSELNAGYVDLSTIYQIHCNNEEQINELLTKLKKDPAVAYAEREVDNQLTYQPNDTANYRQWYLSSVRAFQAWDLEKGDSTVLIAITDTGSDTDHEDFGDALFKNLNDPINGIDDDNDGYIDNYYGWDVAANDGTVDADQHAGASHGTNVAGIASSSTDNVTGISGCGFNTRILTVKIDNANGQLVGAYQGVVYAADQGAPIINCSWGSYTYSQLAEDIINYAAINRGALIICGAGNGPFSGPNTGTGIEQRFYPAAYDNAMAIGALLESDTVKLSSNYGYWLDLFAPGEAMWTTQSLGGYGITGGTSMAAPVVAAGAALVKSQNPGFTSRQIEERLINSAIELDSKNEAKYQGKTGAGKIDFYNALAIDSLPGIRMENIIYSNRINSNIVAGDSLFISGDFRNYLEASSAVNVQIEELGGMLQSIKTQISLPAIGSSASVDNFLDPFIFKLNSSIPLNQRLEFKISINAGNYSKVQYVSTIVNSDYLSLDNGEMSATISSTGSIGYSGGANSQGNGVRFRGGSSLLYEGSIMIGNSGSYLLDQFRGVGGTEEDFNSISLVREINYAQAEIASSSLYDDGGFSAPPRLEVEQNNYFYDSTYTENALLFNYKLRNKSVVPINGIYVGIIADWDLIDYSRNQVSFDDNRKLGISSSLDSSILAGLMAISHPNQARHYAIDNQSGGLGGVDLSDGFTDAEKYTTLQGGRDSAGYASNGSDIIDVISMGPFNLPTDSSLSLTFAMLVANDLSSLQEAADSAISIYNNLPIGIEENNSTNTVFRLYPNPANEQLNIVSLHDQNEPLQLRIVDLNGRLLMKKTIMAQARIRQITTLNISSLKSGVYLMQISNDESRFQDIFVVSRTTN